MKKYFTAVTAALVIFALSACSSGGDDEVVVQTNAGDVTKGDFYNEMKEMAGDQVLQQMVYTKILEEQYDVTDEEVQEQMGELKEQYGGEQGLQQMMMQQGIENMEALEEQVRQSLLFLKATTDGVEVSDEEIENYYNEHKEDEFTELKTSHILVEKEEEAQTIKEQLENGEDFAELAKQHSIDPGSAKEGGDLGYLTKNSQMLPEFLNTTFKLDVDEVSDPVETSAGFHIIKVTDKKVTSLEDAKDGINDQLLQEKAKPLPEVFNELNKDIEVEDQDFEELFNYEDPEEENSEDSSSGEENQQNQNNEENNNQGEENQ